MAKENIELGLSIEIDDPSGDVIAAYLRIRRGKVAATKELANGNAYADYDKNGKLLGIEMLGPCDVRVLDKATRGEPSRVKNFLREAVPRKTALA